MQFWGIKQKQMTFLLYFIFTIVPSLLISFMLTEQKMADYEQEFKMQAHWSASLHAKNIDTFIGETMGRFEMLSTLIKVQHYSLSHVEEILKETQKKDDRFSGFYWTNPKGDILISTVSPFNPVNVGDRSYFQQALKSGQTSISDVHHGRVTGKKIITIATPVIENDKVIGVLLASLLLEELENHMTSDLKDEVILVTTDRGKTIIDAGTKVPDAKLVSDSIEISHVPWKVTSIVNYEDKPLRQQSFFLYLVIVFIITNIFLLLFHNARLKWKNRLAKEQYEFHKMELIGNLAASTAHEIRNPLTGISGLVKLLSEDIRDEKAQTYFGVIQNEITRINSIVSELLFLGRPTAHTLNTCNVNDILRDIEPIIQSESNFMNVQLTIHYSEKDLQISCVKDHLKQVLLNLSKNSLHAMPHGGELTIAIDSNEDCCFINVTDTGSGIPKEELDKVFHPFFSRKKDGSGLGLTVCKRIIDSIDGGISIQSIPDKGTQVGIWIPLVK